MDWEVIIKAAGLFVFGTLFLWLGVDGWKRRRKERISAIEAVILKVGGGDEPLPFNGWDRMMAYVQPILMLLLGPAMIFTAYAIVFA